MELKNNAEIKQLKEVIIVELALIVLNNFFGCINFLFLLFLIDGQKLMLQLAQV